MTNHTALVSKLWNYCSILRDDGLSYGDYVEQLTFLLFLKMADEQSRLRGTPSAIPKGKDWPSLLAKDGDELEVHYRHTLEELGKCSGMLGIIFRKAQNKIQDPAKLRRLIVDLIDKEQWSSLSADVKGDAYEGLLQKNAEDVKGGAGQYFTPRSLIGAVVDVMAPAPGQTVCDPAGGTGGFILSVHDYIARHHPLDRGAAQAQSHEFGMPDDFCHGKILQLGNEIPCVFSEELVQSRLSITLNAPLIFSCKNLIGKLSSSAPFWECS